MITQLRQAARSLLRRPAFTATVVATLAVGLGTSAAIFTVVDAVLLRSLPFVAPERLVEIWETVSRETVERRSFAYPDFIDLREQSTSYEELAALNSTFFTVRGPDRAERVAGAIVSSNYFRLLGTAPALGGGFAPREGVSTDAGDGGDRQVVLAHDYWQTRFGSDPTALGKAVDLDGQTYTVVGVMPPGFVSTVDGAQLWTSFEALPKRFLESRDDRWHSVIARLAEGVTEDRARQELSVIFARLEQEYPDSNLHYSADLGPLSEQLFGDLRAPLLTLLSATGLVLLVACANVAGLLLVHAARRAPEMALRRALGATAWGLLRRQLAETTLFGLTAGALGIGLAVLLTRVLARLSPIELPSFVELDLGPRLLAFAALLSLMVGALLAIGSTAMRGHQSDTATALRSGTNRPGAHQPALALLLVAEVALATLLAVGAGLLLTSFGKLLDVEPGFASERLAFARVSLPAAQEADDGRLAALRAQLLETTAAVPGVRAVALATDSPLEGGYSATVVSGEETPLRSDRPWSGAVRVYRHLVTPGFFGVAGIALLRGRDFESTDRGDSPGVAILTESLARKIWPGREALGQRFKLGPPIEPGADSSEVEWVLVVGVVSDHRYRSLVPDPDGAPEDPDLYFSMGQFDDRDDVVVLAATATTPDSVLPALRRSLEQLDRELAIYNAETIEERLFSETARPRFASSLLAGFAGVTLFLAVLGVYGMVAYEVAARLRDIGVRLALGAGRGQVVRQVMVGAARWLILGTILGLVGAAFATGLLRSQLYEVVPLEPRIYLATALLLLMSGTVAALLPALRAGRVDPVDVLRSE